MRDDEVLIGDLLEETWMHLEQVAAACRVEPAWLLQHIDTLRAKIQAGKR